jgi:hypothetical protein
LFGTPDLVLCFTGAGLRPFVLVIEAKLWAEKSGVGQDDQLRRYLSILGDLAPLNLEVAHGDLDDALAALLYLTPRDTLSEIRETALLCDHTSAACDRLFRAQWQDIIIAVAQTSLKADGISKIILDDLAEFLRRRGLQYFGGFAHLAMQPVAESDGCFYDSGRGFRGFGCLPLGSLDEKAGAFFASCGIFSGFRRCGALAIFSARQGDWVR